MGCSGWLHPGVGKVEIVRPHYLQKHIKTHEMESTQQQRNGDPNMQLTSQRIFYISLPWLADRFCWCFFAKKVESLKVYSQEVVNCLNFKCCFYMYMICSQLQTVIMPLSIRFYRQVSMWYNQAKSTLEVFQGSLDFIHQTLWAYVC